VIDTNWEDDCPSPMGQGRQLGGFNKRDSAKVLALQRMAYGDLGVIVVDMMTGERVFPAPGRSERPRASHPRNPRDSDPACV
jgi:hypothetical protein